MSAPTREIILGVGGGIAAYKACDLLRRLQDEGFAVTVIPTPSSLNFVGKATWEALSGREVTSSVFESVEQIRHVSLAKVAEAIVIAPATADLIARIAAGRADDLLTNVILASTSPILIVPAMHPAMWFNAATQANVSTLRARGIDFLEPVEGALTSGDIGKGRFPETSAIIERFQSHTLREHDLRGLRILVTAGGTREAIDPVRFIGNKSTGKQGIAIAEAAIVRGAEVTLIIANSDIPAHPMINRIDVSSVAEMSDLLHREFKECNILLMSAAISDARPEHQSHEKIKKGDFQQINLIENPDLLASLPAHVLQKIVVAFAAETDGENVVAAQAKMKRKNADVIYLNNVADGKIFGSAQTSGSIIDESGVLVAFSDISKEMLAHELLNQALLKFNKLG
jgi:phosphopantothenoylcysteine decarboxylase/phosphopantothenate--cysteine ligase